MSQQAKPTLDAAGAVKIKAVVGNKPPSGEGLDGRSPRLSPKAKTPKHGHQVVGGGGGGETLKKGTTNPGGGGGGGGGVATPTSPVAYPQAPPTSRLQSIDRALHHQPRLRKQSRAEETHSTWATSCKCCWDTYMSCLDCFVGCPCFTIPVYSLSTEAAKHSKLFKSLGLTETDVGVFFIFFRRIDADGSGSITIEELLSYLGFECNRFTRRVFSIFDEDNSGSVDFREFVLSNWNYCTLIRASLVLFAFDLYDKDASGQLELGEVERLLLEVYGSNYKDNPHARNIVVELHERQGAQPGMPLYMNINDFGNFCRKHPALLMPAFLYQEAIRHRICGPRFWSKCADIRFKLSDGEYVPIGVLLEAAINKKMALGIVAADDKGKKKKHDSQAIRFLKNIGGIKAVRQSKSNVLLLGANNNSSKKVAAAASASPSSRKEGKKRDDKVPDLSTGKGGGGAAAMGSGSMSPSSISKKALLTELSSSSSGYDDTRKSI